MSKPFVIWWSRIFSINVLTGIIKGVTCYNSPSMKIGWQYEWISLDPTHHCTIKPRNHFHWTAVLYQNNHFFIFKMFLDNPKSNILTQFLVAFLEPTDWKAPFGFHQTVLENHGSNLCCWRYFFLFFHQDRQIENLDFYNYITNLNSILKIQT